MSERPRPEPPRKPSRRAVIGSAIAGGAALATGGAWYVAEHREEPLAQSAGGQVPILPTEEADTTGLLFDAQYAERGFSEYGSFAPQATLDGRDRGIAEDPLGEQGKVAWFDSRRRLSVGTPWPRSSALTPTLIQPGHEWWVLFDVMVPSDQAPPEADDWIALGTGAFGPPYKDTSPLGLAVVRSHEEDRLYLQIGGNYAVLGERVTFPVDTWMRFVEGFQFTESGWSELSMGRVDGELKSVNLSRSDESANSSRSEYPARIASVNGGGANSARVGVYGNKPARVHYARHRVATSREALLAGL